MAAIECNHETIRFRVMIVDDVLTTGSTVEECSRMLKRAGAAEVMVVTVARAVL